VFKIFKVSGTSMSPTLVEGEFVLSTNLKTKLQVKPEDLVILKTSSGYIVKRILRETSDSIVLKSDSSKDTSVYCYRPLPKKKLVGRVLASFSRVSGLRIFFGNSLNFNRSLKIWFKKIIGQ
tara:strand:+ start:1459 stop:1824 length:366 start_codon:yes stop_codon:yes gene_type:complete